MKIMGRKEIERLIETKSDYCISLYLPVHRLGDQQDPIRYKNLLGEAEKLLTARGLRSADAVKLLAPEYDLVKDSDYWMNLGAEGLAVFYADDLWERYPLPRKFAESVTVATRFRVKPLIPLITGDGCFFILALNKSNTRLFVGTRLSITETGLPEGAPASIAEVLRYDDPQKQLQFHTGTGASRDERGAMFHGHGVGIDEERENIIRFFQQLAKELYPQFITEQIPVVLAGDISLPPIYRDQDRSGMLFPETIDSNPESMTLQALHEMAWQLVGPVFAEKEKNAREKFDELQGTGQTSIDIVEIVIGAHGGRVETLFVEENVEQWGVFDPEKQQVKFTLQDDADSVDLLDLAAAWTLKNSGAVYVKKRDEMPGAEKLAAVLRY